MFNSIIHRKFNEWLADKNLGGVKINKFKESLLNYAFGYFEKRETYKMGRTKIPLLEKLESSNIIYAHNNMTDMLKLAKKNKHKYKGSIIDFIDMSARQFLFAQKDNPRWKDEYKSSISNKNYKHFTFISLFIKQDIRLKKLFESFEWQPKQYAKKLIARMLDISESTFEKKYK